MILRRDILPDNYKGRHKIPLTVDVLSTVDPSKVRGGVVGIHNCGWVFVPFKESLSIEIAGTRWDYSRLSPFITSTFKHSFSGVRTCVFTCLLRASSN